MEHQTAVRSISWTLWSTSSHARSCCWVTFTSCPSSGSATHATWGTTTTGTLTVSRETFTSWWTALEHPTNTSAQVTTPMLPPHTTRTITSYWVRTSGEVYSTTTRRNWSSTTSCSQRKEASTSQFSTYLMIYKNELTYMQWGAHFSNCTYKFLHLFDFYFFFLQQAWSDEWLCFQLVMGLIPLIEKNLASK